ncbi:MAG TPA: barstar family protein [Friedmanniella sp.]
MSAAGPGSWPAGGVHRVLGSSTSVAAELVRRGWGLAVVPASTTDEELWDALAGALGLPDWFGRNLDALEEALRDLPRPTALVLARWTAYARARPERWDRLLHVLRERADQAATPLVVLLVD